MKPLIVIALGGNALLSAKDTVKGRRQRRLQSKFSFHEEMVHVHSACKRIKDIIESGNRVVLTHGNGPQVGDILLQQHCARDKVPELPLDVCGAQTQGEIGYILQRTLRSMLMERRRPKAGRRSETPSVVNRLQSKVRPVITVLTQTVVDRDDPAFNNPTKFVGPFFPKPGPGLKKDSNRGYRKVVPSPDPKWIVEAEEIRFLVNKEYIVIACGGGGIPVFKTQQGLQGAEAVIDKDLASERLATSLMANTLLILTDVDCAYIDFGTPKQEPLGKISLKEVEMLYKKGQFPPGSMGPKILASIRFLKNDGSFQPEGDKYRNRTSGRLLSSRRAIITSPEKSLQALRGKAGTVITS